MRLPAASISRHPFRPPKLTTKLCLHAASACCAPHALQAGGAVASLDVSDNNLSASAAHLAAGLAQLTALKALTMNNCALATLPLVGLGPRGLPGLQTLELCGNSFGRCCPADGLAACPRLRSLDLSGALRGGVCFGLLGRGRGYVHRVLDSDSTVPKAMLPTQCRQRKAAKHPSSLQVKNSSTLTLCPCTVLQA